MLNACGVASIYACPGQEKVFSENTHASPSWLCINGYVSIRQLIHRHIDLKWSQIAISEEGGRSPNLQLESFIRQDS